jgi:D-arabinose 1-dehydrogenase-like Zn-dependent alcohol dehydrogenase
MRVGVSVGLVGACGYCARCRGGEAFACETMTAVTGVTRDGYTTHMLADASALVQVPDELDAVESALLLCAGVTTFNALCNCGADPAI